jgi:hypothetical protein
MQNSASGRGISSTSLDQGLSFSSDFGSADLTAREGFTRDATRPRVRPLLRLSPPPSSAMATSMAGVTGIPGQIVRGKYPLIELVPGGM